MGRNEPFGLAFGVGHCVTSLSALGDFALLLEFREVAGGGGIRDMEEFLDFVVRDACLLRKQRHDLGELLLLADLDDSAGFSENKSDNVLGSGYD